MVVLYRCHTVAYNSWLDHVLGWWKQRHNPNVLFLKYEDMMKVKVYRSVSCLFSPLSQKLLNFIGVKMYTCINLYMYKMQTYKCRLANGTYSQLRADGFFFNSCFEPLNK